MSNFSSTHFNPIPYGKQSITDDDVDAVCKALRSEFLTQGPEVEQFEKKFSEYIGCKFSVAVANGTAALHLSALALNIKPGDRVITTPITFAASANCVRYCGGEVVFADIDPATYLIDIDYLKAMLKKKPKGFYKGVIPVDFSGRAVDMEQLRELANEYGLWILEDACHAPGGFFTDSKNISQKCGNGQYADLAIFSFHPVKHIATGEGGMITTNNLELYKQLLILRTHGIVKDSEKFTNSIDLASGVEDSGEMKYPGWYMEMQELGFNYRLTDFQAALGVSQLKKANERLARRREIAGVYANAFSNKPYVLQQSGGIPGHAYHLYVINVKDRLGLYNYLRENNIYTQVHYIPVHLMPYYRRLGWNKGDFPFAENYYSSCISLPMYPTLSKEEQDFVINCIDNFYF